MIRRKSPKTPDNSSRAGGLTKVEESARSQSVWMSVARIAAAVLTMAIPMVLARVLDQTTFGYYKQIFLVASTMGVLTLGIPGSLYYFVPRDPEQSQRYQVQSALLLVGLGLLGGTIVLVASPTIERLFDAPVGEYLPWIALFVALSIPAAMIPTSPMVDRRARLAATLVTGLDLARAVLLVVVALVTRSLLAIVLISVVVVVFRVGSLASYLVWRRKQHPGRGSGSVLRSQLAYSLPFAGAAVIAMARSKLHSYFVAAGFSAAEFAVYAVATLSIPLIGQFTQTVGEVVVIENSKHYAADRTGEMRRVWHRATFSLALLLLPIFVIAVLFAQDIMVVLFGPAYAEGAPIFRVYMLIVPLSVLLASPMLRATADLRVMLLADFASLVVAVGSLLLLIGPLGPLGAVASLVIARATYIALATGRTAHRLQLSPRNLLPWRGLIMMLLVASATGLLASALTTGLHPVLRVFLGGGLAFVAYGTIVFFTGLVPESERDLLVAILRRTGVARILSRGSDAGPE